MKQYIQKKNTENLDFPMPVSNVNSGIGDIGIRPQKTWERIQPIQLRRNKATELSDSQRTEAESQNGLIQRCGNGNVVQFDGFLGARPDSPTGNKWDKNGVDNTQRDHIIPHSLIKAYVNKLVDFEKQSTNLNAGKKFKQYKWIQTAINTAYSQMGESYTGKGLLNALKDDRRVQTSDRDKLRNLIKKGGMEAVSKAGNNEYIEIINRAVSWMPGNIVLNGMGKRIMDHTDVYSEKVRTHLAEKSLKDKNDQEIKKVLKNADVKSEADSLAKKAYNDIGLEGLDYELLHVVYSKRRKRENAEKFALSYQEAFNKMQEVVYNKQLSSGTRENYITDISRILEEIAKVEVPFDSGADFKTYEAKGDTYGFLPLDKSNSELQASIMEQIKKKNSILSARLNTSTGKSKK